MRRRRFLVTILLTVFSLLGCGSGFQDNPMHLPLAAKSTWERHGTIIAGTAAEEYSVQEPSVLYEDGSVVFGGTAQVFKMWHTCGWLNGNVCYAESVEGFNFTRYNEGQPILRGIGRPFVMRQGNMYYMYATKEVGGQGWSRYESSDGIHWMLTAPKTLTIGDVSWNKLASGNIYVWVENTTWYALYEALGTDESWRIGLATSTDGISWSKDARNPVLSYPYCGGPEIHKIASTYYMWGQCNQRHGYASDIYRLHSTDLITWTPDLIELSRETPDEGPGDDNGQVADPTMVTVNGKTYMYYDATPTQKPNAANAIHLKVAVTNMNIPALAALK